jgi:hypothetical protein
MAPAQRRYPPWSISSIRERYWPGVHGYPWSVARVAGLVPVFFVSGIIGVAYFVAVPISLVPLLKIHPLLAFASLIVFHWIYLNVVANYALLVLSDPGRVPPDWKQPLPMTPSTAALGTSQYQRRMQSVVPAADGDFADAAADGDVDDFVDDQSIQRYPLVNRRHEPSLAEYSGEVGRDASESFKYYHLMEERAHDGGWRYCRKCCQMKPDRSHHCSVCGVCILRMDHHCVFVATCVGFLNHKFFLLFVVYAFFGCTFVAVVGFPAFIHAIGEGRGDAPVEISPVSSAVLVVGYILMAAFSLALSVFVMFHAYLVARGRSTIELYDVIDPVRAARIARYDLGMRENMRLVFGNSKWHWPLPTRFGIEGDGLSYNRATDVTEVSHEVPV